MAILATGVSMDGRIDVGKKPIYGYRPMPMTWMNRMGRRVVEV
jgi:hypothetical protein